ncbi:hypothetical protein TRQ7_00750 [Thermotoga sp. RQ7]|uniref:hypothetical protein n=1 Tax=Thermotoga sp. RQ7 TaxID=126738 RepID=UPI0005A36C4B|nr:hypothetical protein [Thermotoga sp. RQ7]AJG40000.1 hypothetical protein TRQ7_00750 [Thermotoga sp. RQ7]
MRVESVGYNPVYPNYAVQRSLSTGNTPVMSKEQMEQILFFSLYQQTGLDLKLVRIAGELYSGKTMDQLV